jgi:DinB family protein
MAGNTYPPAVPGFSPAAVARLLAATADELRNEVEALPDEVRGWHPAPGEWCVNEVLGHLVEAEGRGFAGRIQIILDHENPRLETWDQVAVTRDRADCGRPGDQALAELLAARVISVELVEGLSEESLERGGEHVSVGPVTVRELLQEWVHHDRNHVKQILSNVQAYAWAAMGNTRKFSDV